MNTNQQILYPSLAYFLGGYMHQVWDLEFADLNEALAKIRADRRSA